MACGGTLWQHLLEVQGWDVHGDPTEKRRISHDVEAQADSRLAAAVGGPRVEGCVSHHHQGVAEVGQGQNGPFTPQPQPLGLYWDWQRR